MVTITLYTRQQKRHWCIEQSFGLCGRGRGWDDLWEWHWMLSFKPTFSLSSFTFIKRLFSSSWLSAKRVVSSAYLRLLIFLPAILIPACASYNLAFCMMYSAYKLNKQGDNIQPWWWNQSVVLCPVLTVASWPAYRFLRRQVRWSGIPLFKNFLQFVVSCHLTLLKLSWYFYILIIWQWKVSVNHSSFTQSWFQSVPWEWHESSVSTPFLPHSTL